MPTFETQPIFPQEQEARISLEQHLAQILNGNWQKRLKTGDFEDAKARLEQINVLKQWRDAARASSIRPFYDLFEGASVLAAANLTQTDRKNLKTELAENLSFKMQGLSPRQRDLYQAFLAELEGSVFTPQFEATAEKIAALKDSGDLNVLLDSSADLDLKLNRIKTRLNGYLFGMRAIDRREGLIQDEAEKKERQEKIKSQPSAPPPAKDESKPGMNEMEKHKEGEHPPALWTISPAYGGYYKKQSFDTWDSSRNTWFQSNYQYKKATFAPDDYDDDEACETSAELNGGQWYRLPFSEKHQLVGIEPNDTTVRIKQDQNGDYVVFSEKPQKITVFSALDEAEEERPKGPKTAPPNIPGQLSQETEAKLAEIAKRKKGNISRARALRTFILRTIKYSNKSPYNAIYDNHPNGYIGGIDEYKQADCAVGNTYFAGLCARLNIPVRHCVGHMVKGKDPEGNSRITSGTGYAWSEVWDEEKNLWVRIDATSAGDPQLEDEDQDSSEHIPGDYGEAGEAIGPTDEEVAALKEKLVNLTEKLSYTSEEQFLAESASVELKEARQIVREIQKAESVRLPTGELVIDQLSRLFGLIIESRKTTTQGYTGPARKSEGGAEIEDIVAHKIGIKAGETDPMSRRREKDEVQKEKIFGGFDLYLIGDKSYSMTESLDGEHKWELQRQAIYLILGSLDRFQKNLARAQARMQESLSVRTQVISFRGEGPDDIDEDKPLTGEFSPVDKVKLWKSLGNQGTGNGDVPAMALIRDSIRAEIVKNEKSANKPEDRLRLIIACSDGEPDSAESVHRLAQELGELNAVVVGVGLTKAAEKVKTIFDTPCSIGDLARDINDLPIIVAKHVITEAIKLFPNKGKLAAEKMINQIITKFGSI